MGKCTCSQTKHTMVPGMSVESVAEALLYYGSRRKEPAFVACSLVSAFVTLSLQSVIYKLTLCQVLVI